MNLPHVVVLSLGGTIASAARAPTGVTPSLTAGDLLGGLPSLERVARLTASSFRQVPSSDLTLSDAIDLAGEIDARVSAGAEGVVVTQGTDTLEEMAFALDCLLDVDVPVVLTGAMRNPTQPGADGPANLLAAVQTAASRNMRRQGVCVVFNDEIHAARFVRKAHSASPAAFRSAPGGPLGAVVEGRVSLYTRALGHTPHSPVASERPQPWVPLLRMALGGQQRLLEALEREPPDGLVVEGFGAGHVPGDSVPVIERLARRVPVILASRTGDGEILRATYGFPGSESDLLSRGLISAGFLDGAKARIMLMLLLAGGRDRTGIQQAFADAFSES